MLSHSDKTSLTLLNQYENITKLPNARPLLSHSDVSSLTLLNHCLKGACTFYLKQKKYNLFVFINR